MTALNLANIPSNINSYERLATWAIQALANINGAQEVNAVEGVGLVPIAQCQVAKTADGVDRFVLSAYVPLDFAALNSPSQKTWMAAEDIGTAAPHVNFLNN